MCVRRKRLIRRGLTVFSRNTRYGTSTPTHHLNPPSPHKLSSHHRYTPSQHTLTTLPRSTPSQHSIPTHPHNPHFQPHQHTLSTHIFNPTLTTHIFNHIHSLLLLPMQGIGGARGSRYGCGRLPNPRCLFGREPCVVSATHRELQRIRYVGTRCQSGRGVWGKDVRDRSWGVNACVDAHGRDSGSCLSGTFEDIAEGVENFLCLKTKKEIDCYLLKVYQFP